MFRIKTDIRQFKCDDNAQVEDLIRNWVIRPSDLIYQTDEKRWEPIGDHPVFQPIFDQLAQDALNDPELTPVSEVYDESQDYDLDEISGPNSSASDASTSESSAHAANEADGDAAKASTNTLTNGLARTSSSASDESTDSASKPEDKDEANSASISEASDDPREEVSDEILKEPSEVDVVDLPAVKKTSLAEPSDLPAAVKPKLSLKSFQILKKAPKKTVEEDSDDAHSDLPAPIAKPTSEPAPKSDAKPLPIPEAPAGVEPSPVPDEVTVMTERTAELLGLDEEDITTTQEFSAFRRPEAPEGVEPVTPSEETTNVFVRDEDDSQEIEKAVSKPAPKSTSGASGVEVNFTRDEDDDDEPRMRRGDLPEELFLTNEISSPFDRQALLDELGDGDLDADSGWDDLASDDLRSTDEFDNPKVIVEDDYSGKESSEASEEVTQMTAMSDVLEADRERQPDNSASSIEAPTEREDSDPQDLSEVSDAADPVESSSVSEVSAAQELSQPSDISEASDPFTQFDVDAEEIDSDAIEPVEYEDGESIYENELEAPAQDEVFINRGYKMALPFPIGATEEDVPFGVVPSSMTQAEKDRAFPYPKPKAHMELVTQRFGFFDMSKYVIVAFIVIVVLIIITAVAFSQ